MNLGSHKTNAASYSPEQFHKKSKRYNLVITNEMLFWIYAYKGSDFKNIYQLSFLFVENIKSIRRQQYYE